MKCLFLSGLRFIKGLLGFIGVCWGPFMGVLGGSLGVCWGSIVGSWGLHWGPLGSIWDWPVVTSDGKRQWEECTDLIKVHIF